MRQSFKVLFLSARNSARGIIAEALVNARGDGLFEGYSAGFFPADRVHPHTLEILRHQGIDTTGLHPKSAADFVGKDRPKMDLIFTLCDADAGERCPAFPGLEATANWIVPDPTAAPALGIEPFLESSQKLRKLIRILGLISPGTLGRMALTWEPEKRRREAIPPRVASALKRARKDAAA